MKYLLLVLFFISTICNAEPPVIWHGSYVKSLASLGYEQYDGKVLRILSVDPTAGAGVAAPIGSVGQRNNGGTGELWLKVGAADTAWTELTSGGGGPVDLTTDVTGVLPLANGGTNKNLTASNGAVVYSDADSFELSAVGSAGQVLQSGGAGAPTWSTPTYPSASGSSGQILRSNGTNNLYSTATFPNTATQYDFLYASAANTWSSLATANTSSLVTSSTGVPSWASGGVANRVLRTDGTTISFSQVDLTTDVTATLPVGNGGTGLTTVGTANQLFGTNNAGNAFEHKSVLATSAGALTAPLAIQSNTSLILQDPGAGTNTWTVQSPTLAGDFVLTLPTDDGNSGQFLQTDGNGVTTWAAAGSGTVSTGTAGNLSLYPSTGTTVDDVYVQNGNDINVAIASHAALAASRTYTIPEVGASADFVMTQGAQTLSGIKTLNSTPLLKTALDFEDPGAGTNKITMTSPSSLTSSYTFTLPPDAGTNTYVLQTNGSGVTSWVNPSAGAQVNSYHCVHGGNGFGSTGNKIRRWSTVTRSAGTDIVYADSATNGMSWTIQTGGAGTYCSSYTDYRNTAVGTHGISVNASSLTNSINSLTLTERWISSDNDIEGRDNNAVCMKLADGDVVRTHTNGTQDDSSNNVMACLTRVN